MKENESRKNFNVNININSKEKTNPSQGNEAKESNVINVSSQGRFKKSSIASDSDDNLNMVSCVGCEKCLILKEQSIKAINHLRTYVDAVNERINMIYHKTGPKTVGEIDYSLSLDFYHTLYYADLEKLKVGSDMLNAFRNLLKSIRFFNDKIDYIQKKCENFEKLAQETKKTYKAAIKDDLRQFPMIPEMDAANVKDLDVQSIFKSFNIAREVFETNMKELKSSINSSNFLLDGRSIESVEVRDNIIAVSSSSSDLRLSDINKDSFVKNELARLIKENTSLRLELNYIYQQLREENKIYEIKEEKFIMKHPNVKEQPSNQNTPNSSQNPSPFSPERKNSKKYNSGNASSNNVYIAQSYNNPIVVFSVKNDKKDEKWIIAKNYLKTLKQSEFYMI